MSSRDTKLKIIIDAEDKSKGTFKALNAHLDDANTQTRNWTGSIGAAVKALAVLATTAAGFLGYGVKIAADLQTAEVGLATLLGSSDKARDTIKRLKVEAARTPFELPGLTQATQLLSSVTKDGDKSIDILLDIGEALAAMGKGQAELDRIIVNLQQVGAIGYASMVDIKQFAYAGIPIFEMLQEQTGLAGEALSDFISNGGVSFDMLTGMFDRANDEGGKFFNAYVNQSGTFNQALSNMKDSFGIFLADIATGTGLFAALTAGMMEASNLLTNYRDVLNAARDRAVAFFDTFDKNTGLISLFSEQLAGIAFMWQERLKPALLELWETLKPLEPFLDAIVKVIGTALVIGIGAAIMALGGLAAILIEVLTWATKFYTFFADSFVKVWDAVTDRIAGAIEKVERFIDLMRDAMEFVGGLPGKVADKVTGGLKSTKVNDAVISPSGQIVTTHPDDWLIATKNPRALGGGGSNITININGGTYLSPDVAEEIGDMIMGRLKLSNQL